MILETQQITRSLNQLVLLIEDRVASDLLVISEFLDRLELLLIVCLNEFGALSTIRQGTTLEVTDLTI
jgi:hypothetical protein